MNFKRLYLLVCALSVLFFILFGYEMVRYHRHHWVEASELEEGGYPIHLPIVMEPLLHTPATPSFPGGLTPTPTVLATATNTAVATTPPTTPTQTPVPQGPAFTRFNFEVAGHEGRDGTCEMKQTTGELLLIWEMKDGYTDSANHPQADANGWIPANITHVNVYVEVFCNTGSGDIRMDIYNGVIDGFSGEVVGWLTRNVHNAIEIGWPAGYEQAE